MISDQPASYTGRPDFMYALGLLPPYTPEDVRMAYREKAKQAHPDHGGSIEEFVRLQQAYDRALEYVKFTVDRRQWLAARVERYIQLEQVRAEVRRRGGHVETEEVDWIKRSIGEDFAILTDRLRGIRLRAMEDGDHFLHFLATHLPALEHLVWLDLAGSRISDEGLMQLAGLPWVERLDVSDTPLTERGLRVVHSLRRLSWLNLSGTSVGWWKRRRLHRSHPQLRIVANHRTSSPGQPGTYAMTECSVEKSTFGSVRRYGQWG